MSKSRAIGSRLLANAAYGLMFCGVIAVPSMVILIGSRSGVWAGLLCLVPFMLNWIIREFCRKSALFFLLHVLTAMAATGEAYLVTGDFSIFCVVLIFSAICCIFSISLRVSGTALELTVGMILASAGLYVLAGIVVSRLSGINLYGFYSVLTAVIFLLSLLKIHMANMDQTLSTAGQSDPRQAEGVRRFGGRTAAIFTVLAALIMLLLSRLPVSVGLRAFLGLLQSGFLAVLGFITRLFSGDSSGGAAVTEEIEVPTQEPIDLSGLMGDYEAPEPLLSDEAFQALIYAGLIITLIAVLLYIVRSVYRRFGGGGNNAEDYREFFPEETRERVEGIKRRFSLFGPYFGEGNRGKVRKMFYKKVRAYHKKRRVGVAPSETALDIAGRMRGDDEGIDALGELYGKARYGAGEIGEDEMEAVKGR